MNLWRALVSVMKSTGSDSIMSWIEGEKESARERTSDLLQAKLVVCRKEGINHDKE